MASSAVPVSMASSSAPTPQELPQLQAAPFLNRLDLKSLRTFLVSAEAFYRSPVEPANIRPLRSLICPNVLSRLQDEWTSIVTLKEFVRSGWGSGLLPLLRERHGFLPYGTPNLELGLDPWSDDTPRLDAWWIKRLPPKHVQFMPAERFMPAELRGGPRPPLQWFSALSQPSWEKQCILCIEKFDDCNLSCYHGFCKSCITTKDPQLPIALAQGVCPFALVHGCAGVQRFMPPLLPIPVAPVCGIFVKTCDICMNDLRNRFTVTLYCNHQLCSECYHNIRTSTSLLRKCPFCNDPRLGRYGYLSTAPPRKLKVKFDKPEIIDLVEPPRTPLQDVPLVLNDDEIAPFFYLYDDQLPPNQLWEEAFGPREDAFVSPSWAECANRALRHLLYLREFYRVKFQRVVLAKPTSKCDAFLRFPEQTFAKYKASYTDAIRFLKVPNLILKTGFEDGIPLTSHAFRAFLKPLVLDSNLSFDNMVFAATLTLAQSIRLSSCQFISDTNNAMRKKRTSQVLVASFPIEMIINHDMELTTELFEDYVQRFDDAWGSCPSIDQATVAMLKSFLYRGIRVCGPASETQAALRFHNLAHRLSFVTATSRMHMVDRLRNVLIPDNNEPTLLDSYKACENGNCLRKRCLTCMEWRILKVADEVPDPSMP